MKSIVKRIKNIVINTIIATAMLSTKVFAGIDLNLNKFKPSSTGVTNASQFMEKVSVILGAMQAIGSAVSVIALVIIGIKYMLGSVEEKAEYKNTFKPYIIGCALLFMITNLVQIIFQIAVKI